MSRSWEGGSTRAWRKLRAWVLNRDSHRCQLRLPGCTTIATHVHHLRGKQHGDDPTYLAAACAHCNLATGDVSGHDPAPQPRTRW
ncbi:HNH endonuclease [Micromonospora globbae]|uniref:HNH endonuclease n=1 Tax=Micromonospora globbae TaxID=1894969 RepID=A0A420ETY5_9ACTN|nr:hypothetical protein [Micromonospora globbae]RKF24131.1 hypothetical protein D7I43_28010 [Micromonospora globbae]